MTSVTGRPSYRDRVDSPAGLRLVLGALGLLPLLLPITSLLQQLGDRAPLGTTTSASAVLAGIAGVTYSWYWLGLGRRRLAPLLVTVTTLVTIGALAVPAASSGHFCWWHFPMCCSVSTCRLDAPARHDPGRRRTGGPATPDPYRAGRSP